MHDQDFSLKDEITWLKDKLVKLSVGDAQIHLGYIEDIRTYSYEEILSIPVNWEEDKEVCNEYIKNHDENGYVQTIVQHDIKIFKKNYFTNKWESGNISITSNELINIEILSDVERTMFKIEHDL